MVLFVLTGYRVLCIVYLDKLTGARITNTYLITIFLPLSEKGPLPGSFSAHFMVYLLAHKNNLTGYWVLGIVYLDQLTVAHHAHTYLITIIFLGDI